MYANVGIIIQGLGLGLGIGNVKKLEVLKKHVLLGSEMGNGTLRYLSHSQNSQYPPLVTPMILPYIIPFKEFRL